MFAVALISAGRTTGVTAGPPAVHGQEGADYGYGASLSAAERAGRDTWYFWTGGNERFWVEMTRITGGSVNLLTYIDSRRHGRRFAELGAITQPGCRAATAPDEHGLWLDQCEDAPVVGIPGEATGIVGLRKFANPQFNRVVWNPEIYQRRPNTVQPPYRVGMTCAFCHVGFDPLNPPVDPESPRWANLHGTIGNQYWLEGKLFNANLRPDDFRWHVGERQPPGTSDTSRFATDHINNPSAINAILNLAARPTHAERMRDGTTRSVPHILKDGADSIGLSFAALRVYVNIGMCSEYSTTLHDPVFGVGRRQKPFDIDRARGTCPEWSATEARLEGVEAFLKTMRAAKLEDAPDGKSFLTASAETMARGQRVFADTCASCHSSRQPPPGTADVIAWYRAAVAREDFLENNFLSNDVRYPATRIGTNVARALGTNAARGGIWEQFSSETYKALPAVGPLTGLHNPVDAEKPIVITAPAGGPGYYRPASLASLWATAPYLHNNSVGTFVKDPSTRGRMAAFMDGMQRMLWPERRLGERSIAATTEQSLVTIPGTTRRVQVPPGTPVDYVASVNPNRVPGFVRKSFLLNFISDAGMYRRMLPNNMAPDFIVDRGHTFGAHLTDDDKLALIEFLKTL